MMEELMKADGLDEAIIGVGQQFDKPDRLIYDYDKCVDIIIKEQNCKYIDAIEYMEFNVVNAYVGDFTPVFMHSFFVIGE